MKKHYILQALTIFLCFCISKADAQTIFTKAGNGSGSGTLFDNNPATDAFLYLPYGVAVDTAGNIYIADQNVSRIRKINASTGIITTVAGNGNLGFDGDGGQATTATLNKPFRVVVDKAGNLFILDQLNNRIRKVNAASGIITTIAGNGTSAFAGDGGQAINASLNSPKSLALDTLGNIYIGEPGRIRKVNASTGIITTIAGNGTSAFSGDGGQATSATFGGVYGMFISDNGNIYFTDYNNNCIRKVDAATNIISTVAGNGTFGFSTDGVAATTTSLVNPVSVCLDGSGNIYISETLRIRKVDAVTGIISTVAGTGWSGFSGDGGPATNATLNSNQTIALDKNRNIYISDVGNSRIRKVDASNGIITTIAGHSPILYSGDGGLATSASLSDFSDVALDKFGNAYITDLSNLRVRRIEAATGIITTVAGDGTNGSTTPVNGVQATQTYMSQPEAVAVDDAGNVFIAEGNQIRKVNTSDGKINTIAGNGLTNSSGNVGDGGLATNANINGAAGVALDKAGNIYIADRGGNRIRKVTASTGIITSVAGNGNFGYTGDGGLATAASLSNPTDIVVDGNGTLYIMDQGNYRIRKVNASTGIISTIAGNGINGFSGDGELATAASIYPSLRGGIALDKTGNIYIADYYNNRIRKIDASTGIITTVAGTGTWAYSIPLGDGGFATSASLNKPSAIALDSLGNMYIADQGHYRLRYTCMTTTPSSSQISDTLYLYPDPSQPALLSTNCTIQTKITPNGVNPVSGNVAFKEWVESTVPINSNGQPYVQRHYQITPVNNASTSTATITLYYTQADFTAYNAAPNHGGDLPIDSNDVANNKVNVKIIKRSGTSGNGTGLFDTYSGTTTGITPTSVVWDANLHVWAVTFDVSGFSGFFITSTNSVLPLQLTNFSAKLMGNDGLLNWQTVNEESTSAFEIERSTDGRNYSNIGTVTASNYSSGALYNFKDANVALLGKSIVYYRLKMVKSNGTFEYSKIVAINISSKEAVVMFYPNPLKSNATLMVSATQKENIVYSILDATGRTIATKSISIVEGSNPFAVDTKTLPTGTYTLLVLGSETNKEVRFIKQ